MSTPSDPYNTPSDDNQSELPSFQPGAGESMPTPGTRPEPPSRILTAVKLMFVGAALSAIGIIFVLLTTDTMRDQLADNDPELTADELDTLVASSVAGSVIFGVVAIGLWIWMALANKRGVSWARVVATVLGGLNILFTLISLVLIPSSGLSLIVSLATIALAAVILWLLFRPESSEYYNAVTEYRHQYGR
jgi:hypothetical protein